MAEPLIPAAQYLRMSTDLQQYSLDNQAETIARYASENRFEIVRTYSDAARSGLRLQNRAGLKQLLKDVMERHLDFRAILVYDVSRWGRFQDIDEAAHYEFLCKSAGVPIHYCAEVFPNDESMAGLILKALKRTMAGEYSRELSQKVRAGMFRLAACGYRLGGNAGYGFRRQLLDTRGSPKQILSPGEQKYLTTERVILIPGPANEVAVVTRIFHEFANERRSMSGIADRLNRDGIPFLNGSQWGWNHVKYMLKNPQYAGTQVWGRTTAPLSRAPRPVPREKWVIRPGAFQAIIPNVLFERTEQRLANMTHRLSNEQVLERLRDLWMAQGRINSELIRQSPLCPSANALYHRFGGLSQAYARLGYIRPELISSLASRQKIRLIRKELIESLLKEFPNDLQEVRRRRSSSLLRELKSGLLIAVRHARSCVSVRNGRSWFIDHHIHQPGEREHITLLLMLDRNNSKVEELRMFPHLNYPGLSIRLYERNPWLESGARLATIADFLQGLQEMKVKM